MLNPLVEMVERISKIERYGIYIEDVNVEEKYKFDDEKKITLTGIPRPVGEYYIVHLNVMVAAHKQEDDGDLKAYPTVQGVYAPVSESIPTCERIRFARMNVAAPIVRGDIKFSEPEHDNVSTKPKPAKKAKYPLDIDKIVSRDAKIKEVVRKKKGK